MASRAPWSRPLAPLGAFLGLSLGIVGLFAAFVSVLGPGQPLFDPSRALGLAMGARVPLVIALLTSFLVVAFRYETWAEARDLEALRPLGCARRLPHGSRHGERGCFHAVALHMTNVDLLDLAAFQPLARIGLRRAAYWGVPPRSPACSPGRPAC